MANGGIIGTVNNPTSSTATGVWQQEEQYEAVRDGTWPSRPLFTTKSLRFNRGSSDFLRRTMSTAGTSDKIGTYSGWVKRSTVSLDGMFFEGKDLAANNYTQIYFQATGALTIYGSGGGMDLVTTALFRDPSAWYHVVVAFDTTQGTASNRVKVYVNGVQQTSFSTGTYLAQNATIYFGVNGDQQGIGVREDGALLWNGYMAEICYVDGQALAPTSFGETNSQTGIWVPKAVTGLTFGNNGCYLDFKNASNLGNVVAGNSTDFTENGLTSLDQSTDTCTTNFATLNPLALRNNPNAYYAVLSQGNLKLKGNATTNNGNSFSTMAFDTGKWYCEVKMIDADNSLFPILGVIPEDLAASANSPSNSGQIGTVGSDTVGYSPDGQKIIAGNETSYGDTFTNNDIIGIAIDCDNGAVYFSKNGTFQASGDPTSGASKTGAALTFTPSKTYFFGASVYKDTNDIEFNFGSPTFAISSGNTDGNGFGNFEYAVPTGYLSLNTKNLAAVLA